jgi:DNA primase
LIIHRDGGEGYYDRFRGRLMFPICDEQGRVIAFSGRVLTGDEKTAKYVNSPETPIFTKSKVFFGLDKSKRAILDAEFAIICEGQIDLIACYMAGIRNIVAPQGTAFTAEHARILKRYVNEVVLCFDSDTAGQQAAVRVLDSLAALGLAVRVAMIPAPHDPDSFIKEFGGSAFNEMIQSAPGFFDFYLNRLCATNDPASDKGRLVIVSSMSEALAKTGNAVLLDTYAGRTAQRLGVSTDAMRAEFRKGSRANARRERSEEAPEETNQPALSPLEFLFLRLLLQNDEHEQWISEHLHTAWLVNPLVREVTEKRLRLHREEQWLGLPSFLSSFEEAAVKDLLGEVLMRPLVQHRDGTSHRMAEEIPRPLEQLADVVLKFRNEWLERETAQLNQRLANPELASEEQATIVQRLAAIRQEKRAALQPINQP